MLFNYWLYDEKNDFFLFLIKNCQKFLFFSMEEETKNSKNINTIFNAMIQWMCGDAISLILVDKFPFHDMSQ